MSSCLGLPLAAGKDPVLAMRAEAVVERVRESLSPPDRKLIRERTWPGLKGWRTLEDGREAMTVTLHVTPEVVTWILGWGSAVEVLAPPSLRTAVAAELASASGAYAIEDAPLRS